MSKEKNYRLQIDLPPSSAERLVKLKEWTEASSQVEVIRNALRLYEAVTIDYLAGKKFYVQHQDGSMQVYEMLIGP